MSSAALVLFTVFPTLGLAQVTPRLTDVSQIALALSMPVSSTTLEQSSIPVVVTLTNPGKTRVYLPTFSSGDGFLIIGLQFHLTLNGNAIPKAGLNEEFGHADGSIDRIRIDSGSTKQVPFDIKNLFKISQPGSYLFSVSMPANSDAKVEIHSQPLRIDIRSSQNSSQ
jgi:hypothetical protein